MFRKIIAYLSAKLLKIDDSPGKIALGVGLGVFSGLLPGIGPLAALFLAFICRANRAAALLGSILTNTWLSLVTFILAVKVGALIFHLNYLEVEQKAQLLIKDFGLAKFFKVSFFDVFLPVFIGYIAISLILGVASYLITFLIIKMNLHKSKAI
jgi:uncharacterized protein (DUF2062 family)